MVAPALIGALVGAGYGYLNNQNEKSQNAQRRQAEATIERNSPWTGMHGKYVQDKSNLGAVEQGALTGATFGLQDKLTPPTQKEAADNATPATMGTVSSGQESSFPGKGGVSGDEEFLGVGAKTPASGEVPSRSFVTQDAANTAAGPQYNWSNPGSVGYSPWTDPRLMAAGYIPPGQKQNPWSGAGG